MPIFEECEKQLNGRVLPGCTETLIAKRYFVQQRLGRGSFGTVYLVLDKKAKDEEKLKVLKEIPVGELNPNETVQANQEAQLLSKLDHPAIVKFHASFLEKESFCIITEYCEGKDLDCKIQECKKNGENIGESQVVEWFIQLLLGVNYMHERRILHRDLKAKNIFLKNNLLKIGDFGVSRLLMGSCDLATTFTGTPYYMSPEALKHQGYDSKSDIWSLGCILHEMCCLEHAFTGYSFVSVVIKIVEGETPSLPNHYSSDLNLLMNRMLNKDPALRPGAGDILQTIYIQEQLQEVKWKLYGASQNDKTLICQRDADQIMKAVQRKFHLQTLRELSEVQKMTPRERMRLRKLNAADEKAKRLKQLAEEKYQENQRRMQELRSRNFQRHSIDVLHAPDAPNHLLQSGPAGARHCQSNDQQNEHEQIPDRLCVSEPTDRVIPEDPRVADEYYKDGFDSCSEDSEEDADEEENSDYESQTIQTTYEQDSDVKAMVLKLKDVLASSCFDTEAATMVTPSIPASSRLINDTMVQTKLQRMKESAVQSMGKKTYNKVYNFLRSARQTNRSEEEVKQYLETLVSRSSECFIVDQILYLEEELQAVCSKTDKA
ncbi:serine/threonine-protein kinase Nek11 [Spea bombifrons]|uniref:serine/threonine-protein kinase Nek11 n=1 Tax=Spea bombifrons TaxID=233779 RepID=UPI00234BE558|nr:serine/threonine-protein kinase Nek11 [Spea bombifrons]